MHFLPTDASKTTNEISRFGEFVFLKGHNNSEEIRSNHKSADTKRYHLSLKSLALFQNDGTTKQILFLANFILAIWHYNNENAKSIFCGCTS